MDLLITMACIACFGLYKVYQSKGFYIEETFEVQEDGSVRTQSGDVPVGQNLMLNREQGAFMKIVKELGLA